MSIDLDAIEAAVLNILDDIKHCHLRFCNIEQLSDIGRAYALAFMNVEETLEGVGVSLIQDMKPKEG